MPTIVTYTDQQPPMNRYPHHIISPPRAGDCCFSNMEELGTPQEDARWVSAAEAFCDCRKAG